jgi:hypothetical protein
MRRCPSPHSSPPQCTSPQSFPEKLMCGSSSPSGPSPWGKVSSPPLHPGLRRDHRKQMRWNESVPRIGSVETLKAVWDAYSTVHSPLIQQRHSDTALSVPKRYHSPLNETPKMNDKWNVCDPSKPRGKMLSLKFALGELSPPMLACPSSA